MSQAASEETELIPRPEKTPAALKAALAVVAPDRLPEMIEGQTGAMAEAIATGSVQPIRSFVAHWAAVLEIERRPATARAYHRSNYLANHAASVEECRRHAIAVAELYRAAFAAVNG
ncbi:hypothetical protein TR51_28245 [Kitasatospora griseola]|uniref:Uncharacterized protein n=1 Tax=Kitasatospora griseola TaxID=2064 RepID=A0A0D0NUG1_KITGR|nr:hypothetical protein [Kitasatospora griseola]KIQ62816.1 hypothetical protein TR51_28245 [Kitasatospora griseola]